ncbi:MAG: biotin/lipoyl-binding protein, partial [Povalibacter sp.]
MKSNARKSVIEVIGPTEAHDSADVLELAAPVGNIIPANTPAPGPVIADSAEIPKSSKRGWLILAALLIVALVGWTVMRKPAETTQPADAAGATAPLELAAVDLVAVQPRVLSRALPLSGSISPVVQATVKSKVSGDVEMLTVREGQDVREGDVIARIDTRNLQAQYDRELAAVDKARA